MLDMAEQDILNGQHLRNNFTRVMDNIKKNPGTDDQSGYFQDFQIIACHFLVRQ